MLKGILVSLGRANSHGSISNEATALPSATIKQGATDTTTDTASAMGKGDTARLTDASRTPELTGPTRSAGGGTEEPTLQIAP